MLFFDVEMMQIIMTCNDSHISICCYLQNLNFFVDYLSDLKREFSLAPSQRAKAEYYLEGQLANYRKINEFHDAI